MNDVPRPDAPRPDEPRPDGALPDAARRDEEPQDEVDPSPAQAQDARRPSLLRRVPWSPWWRPAVAAAAVGALTWGATTSGAAFRSDGAARPDTAATTAAAGEAAFVQAALLGCPGTVPWLDDDALSRPAVEVMASAAPRSVLEATPPRGADDTAATAVPDGAGSTGTPDAAGATADPATTSAVPPDDASSTAGPDDAAATGGGEEPDEGASVLRSTDGREGPLELEHGIPEGLSLEHAASALVHASGQAAPAVVGGQVGLGARPGSRGLTLSACVPPVETQWLVGGGAAPGRSEQLVLTNPGPDAVTVEVSVWGVDGPVTTTGASGIVVPGGGRTVELLDGLAPAVDAPVLAVSATGGPVVAHLAESYREGTTDRGTEVVSPVAAPATDLVVPALPAAPEGHDRKVVLRIAAPGDTQAVVDLTALTEDGAQRLADRVTRVPAGHTVDVELADLPAGATALRLRSDQPVTAGARLEVLPAEGDPEIVDAPDEEDTDAEDAGDAGDAEQDEPLLRAAGDVAWVGATVPVATPSGIALPDRSAVPAAGASLALTAVDGTTAWVTWVDGQGGETSRSVPLPHDTTTLLPVPEDARAVWVVGAGPAGVAASLHLTGGDDRGPLVAATTLPGLPWLRQVTEVRPLVP